MAGFSFSQSLPAASPARQVRAMSCHRGWQSCVPRAAEDQKFPRLFSYSHTDVSRDMGAHITLGCGPGKPSPALGHACFRLFCRLFTRSSTTEGSANVDVSPKL